jgi:crotonobetainyl-CoA:carnitine CoA-transferase CaiB-like acyl-CoA transferase
MGIHDVYPCAGDDEWCVISIRDDHDWRVVTMATGQPDLADDPRWATAESRWARREEIHEMVSRWTRVRSTTTLAQLLQRMGVPAGPMNRAQDVLGDPQVLQRGLYVDMVHPLLDAPLPSETGPAPYRHIPCADLRPAPMLGEHTRDICRRVLALDSGEIERLIEDGVLFAPPVPSETAGSSRT